MQSELDQRLEEAYGGKLRQIQMTELLILQEVDRICKKHAIQYFLVGGSLLGAVRHGGFIPWDDDLDIGMMRPDFERFREICPKELDERFFYQSYRTEENDHYILDKIRLRNTQFRTKFSDHFDIENGLFLDVLVYDVTADTRDLSMRQCNKIYNKNAILNIRWVGKAERDNHYLLALLAMPLLKLRSYASYHRDIERTMRMYETKASGAWLIDSTGLNIKKGPFPAAWFTKLVELEFEGMMLPAPKEYDAYLRRWYGEHYMELPPMEKRFSGHNIVAIDLGEYDRDMR